VAIVMVRKISGGWSKSRTTTTISTKAALPWTGMDCTQLIDRIIIRVLSGRTLHPAVEAATKHAIEQVVRLELQPPPPDQTVSLLQQVAVRNSVCAGSKEYGEPVLAAWLEGLAAVFSHILDAAPVIPTSPSAFTIPVPFIDLVAKPNDLVQLILARLLQFATDEPFAVRPGARLAFLLKTSLEAQQGHRGGRPQKSLPRPLSGRVGACEQGSRQRVFGMHAPSFGLDGDPASARH
jgi:hypothetical protein